MKQYNWSLFILIFLLGNSCKYDDGASNLLASCCGNPAVEETVGAGRVYIPNVFTPDNNGVNDIFTVYSDAFIKNVEQMRIWDQVGNLVFEDLFDLSGLPYLGWDGRQKGITRIGLFSYEIRVRSTDGIAKTITGSVCSFPCENLDILDADEFTYIRECQFPSQNDGNGGYDEGISPRENFDCLE